MSAGRRRCYQFETGGAFVHLASFSLIISACPCLQLCALRSRKKLFREIENHAAAALLAIEDAGGNETDELVAGQVDTSREILKLCKEFLETFPAVPAGNLDSETLGPSELFRTSWEVSGGRSGPWRL